MDLGFPFFLGTNRQHIPVCVQMISLLRTVFSIARAHMSLGTVQGITVSAALAAGVSLWCPSCRQMTRPEF